MTSAILLTHEKEKPHLFSNSSGPLLKLYSSFFRVFPAKMEKPALLDLLDLLYVPRITSMCLHVAKERDIISIIFWAALKNNL